MLKKLVTYGGYIGVNCLIGHLYGEVMALVIEGKEKPKDIIIAGICAVIGLMLLAAYVPYKLIMVMDDFGLWDELTERDFDQENEAE